MIQRRLRTTHWGHNWARKGGQNWKRFDRWDGIHVDGAYWVKRKRGKIELARSYEGGWGPYDWSDPPSMWEILPGGEAPPVLFGPLENPGGWNRGSRFYNELIAGEQLRALDVEADITGLASTLKCKFH